MSNMKDALGRTIDYMRISVTDRCNLRCKYCMPYGVECVPRWDILSLEEIRAVGICAASLGIRHIKVTGGEPLVRRDCCQLVKQLKSIPGIEKVTITTNGVLLERYLDDLTEAGIDGINISLDTLDRDLYQRITGTDALGTVTEAVRRPAPCRYLLKSMQCPLISARWMKNTGKPDRMAGGRWWSWQGNIRWMCGSLR